MSWHLIFLLWHPGHCVYGQMSKSRIKYGIRLMNNLICLSVDLGHILYSQHILIAEQFELLFLTIKLKQNAATRDRTGDEIFEN